jgi:hypothetical protein
MEIDKLIESIKCEISSDNPNWMLISELSRKIATEKIETCPLGFKKGFINFIKSSNWDDSGLAKKLLGLNGAVYNVKIIHFMDEIKHKIVGEELSDKINIFISDKDITGSSKFPMDLPFQRFLGRSTWNNTKREYTWTITNNKGVKIKFNNAELNSIIRDSKLNSIGV